MTDEIQQGDNNQENEIPLENEIPEGAEESQEPEQSETPEKEKEAQTAEELALPGDPEEDEEEEKKTWPKGVAERIKREKAKAARIAAEAAEAKLEVERLRTQQVNQQAQQQTAYAPVTEPPKREDFQNEDDYLDAKLDYRLEQKALKLKAENEERAYIEADNKFRSKIKSIDESGREKYEDYDEKVSVLHSPTFPSNRAMAHAIVDSEFGRDMFYFLGKYPDEAKRIAQLNPVAAVMEVARLENRFKERQRSKISKAPPALSVIKGGQGDSASRNPEKIESVQDFKEWYDSKYGR